MGIHLRHALSLVLCVSILVPIMIAAQAQTVQNMCLISVCDMGPSLCLPTLVCSHSATGMHPLSEFPCGMRPKYHADQISTVRAYRFSRKGLCLNAVRCSEKGCSCSVFSSCSDSERVRLNMFGGMFGVHVRVFGHVHVHVRVRVQIRCSGLCVRNSSALFVCTCTPGILEHVFMFGCSGVFMFMFVFGYI